MKRAVIGQYRQDCGGEYAWLSNYFRIGHQWLFSLGEGGPANDVEFRRHCVWPQKGICGLLKADPNACLRLFSSPRESLPINGFLVTRVREYGPLLGFLRFRLDTEVGHFPTYHRISAGAIRLSRQTKGYGSLLEFQRCHLSIPRVDIPRVLASDDVVATLWAAWGRECGPLLPSVAERPRRSQPRPRITA